MIFNRDMCHLLFCSTKANDEYFWSFLFPTFLLGIKSIGLQLLVCLIYGHILKGRYIMKSGHLFTCFIHPYREMWPSQHF